jgi:hypothetical protein
VARFLLLTLPALAAAIVAWTVLGGADERIRYVQVLGGPTREGSTLSLLLCAFEQRGDDRPVPLAGLPLEAAARAGGANAKAGGTTDATGQLELRLELGAVPAGDPWLRVEETLAGAARLAEGPLALDIERWRADARRQGGWLRGQTRGELRVRVAAESGVFAVPFAGHLIVQVLERRAEGDATDDDEHGPALRDALAHVELDGAELVVSGADAARPAGAAPSSPPPGTDEVGQTRIALRPLEHAVNARVVAQAGSRRGEWYGALPVVPGAMVAALSGSSLAVRSPIARGRAFLSLVSARERIAGAIVPLEVGADGSAIGDVELGSELAARLEAGPTWAVVSSEYDKRSPGAVGWPLHPAFDVTAPRLTFSVPDQLLLDGRSGALYDREQRERLRRSRAASALMTVGALMAAAFWIEIRRKRRQVPGGHAAAADGADDRLPLSPGGWILGVALGCIALGLGALAYFAWLAH